jgi:hypothetical protein
MKNDIIMGQFIIEKHGKREENTCFGDNTTLLCPECFSSKVYVCGQKNKRYVLKRGFLFEKVCSSRQVSCLKCDCEFLQLGNDVRKEKVSDFGDRIRTAFAIFFTILMFVSIVLTAAFAISENETLSMVFLLIFLLSMVIASVICS